MGCAVMYLPKQQGTHQTFKMQNLLLFPAFVVFELQHSVSPVLIENFLNGK